ncbi:MAG: dihydroorotate dehydrogenase electron transfer subunit [Lachnospiraceae bacterium]|nr:dihydroorotate dehydrogenase electron transfer subunit [Lachnospiraceae bacterium]
MSKRKEKVRIADQEQLSPGIFSLWLETPMAEEVKPGQFVGVYPKDASRLLLRPISICDVNENRTRMRLVYRAGGAGTKELSTYRSGEELEILGPLGNGYDIEAIRGKKTLLLGGGIGIPPMLYLARELDQAGVAATVILGYADSKTFLREEFDRLYPTYIATMDGSLGTKGTVIDALNENMVFADLACACGPMPMLKAVKEFAKDAGMKAYISLEERMACGVGACLGCVTKTTAVDEHTHVNNTRVCTEGPVFEASEVEL